MVSITESQAFSCCASHRLATALAAGGPYKDVPTLLDAARQLWWEKCSIPDWLEAFAAHPKIGEHKPVKDSTPDFVAFSKSEQQASASTTTDTVKAELAELNASYLDRYGFIFIICARGRSAPEVLCELKRRLGRPACDELQAAAHEQMQITELRLTSVLQQPMPTTQPVEVHAPSRRVQALLSHLTTSLALDTPLAATPSALAPPPSAVLQVSPTAAPMPPAPPAPAPALRSPITTHVLDTALGVPAKGLPITLMRRDAGLNGYTWGLVGRGDTNEDGRVGTLMAAGHVMPAGRYRMVFDTETYLRACAAANPAAFPEPPFYPECVVEFEVPPHRTLDHYHIPLLLSPFGFSTYKGS